MHWQAAVLAIGFSSKKTGSQVGIPMAFELVASLRNDCPREIGKISE